MIDKKGIILFLFLVFALGYPAQWAIFTFGFMTFDSPTAMDQVFFIAVLWIPALAAGVTRLFFPVDASASSSWWPLPLVGVLRITLVVPLVALLGSGINLLLGGGRSRLATGYSYQPIGYLKPESGSIGSAPHYFAGCHRAGGCISGHHYFCCYIFWWRIGLAGCASKSFIGVRRHTCRHRYRLFLGTMVLAQPSCLVSFYRKALPLTRIHGAGNHPGHGCLLHSGAISAASGSSGFMCGFRRHALFLC